MSVYAEDIGEIEAKSKAGTADALVRAARESGRNPVAIALDYLRLRRGRGRLRFNEYLQYELYDRARWSDEDRARFVSAYRHWPLVNQCNDRDWWAVSEDKWLSASLLAQAGLPVPRTLGVFDRGHRAYPGTPTLRDTQALRAFLADCTDFPLFAKNLDGMWSAGAFRISGCTATHALIDGRDPVPLDDLAGTLMGAQTYLIQACLRPHAFFDGLTGATATVRCLNLIGDDGLRVPYTLLKLPMGGNVADNFWRPGNLLCDLDPDSGEISGLVESRNGKLVRHAALPGAERRLVGECLPDWQALRALNETVALMHAPNRFGSTDIALTRDGPVVVEVNNGCAFELMQVATGQGFLTDEIAAFFDACEVRW